LCKAQSNIELDSLAIKSRTRADIVLSYFDTIRTDKMLYSMKDKYYYVVINKQSYYEEYYVVLDTINKIETIRIIKNNTKTKKQRKQQKQYEQILKEAEPIFDLSKYHASYITKVSGTDSYTFGVLSYFVVKGIDGKRYGEFHLFMPTQPMPINHNLWVYLFRRLSEQIE
jgi:hypothetical protein